MILDTGCWRCRCCCDGGL